MGEAQFNLNMLVDEAKKIGIDFGDLKDYGFENGACTKSCPNK